MEETMCQTLIETKEYYNTWIIENFCRVKNEIMTSAAFSGTNWHGRLLTWKFQHEPTTEGSRIYVRSREKQNCQIVIESLPKDLTRLRISVSGCLGANGCFWIDGSRFYNCLSSDGSLQLRFKVTFISHVLDHYSAVKQVPLPELPKSTLVDNIANMLMHKQFTDLTIITGPKSFRAHKAILVARSTVFAAMFQHQMQESQRNEIVITDVESWVFEQVLRFIYTDKVDGLPRMAHELLAAADKYDLARLKVMCEIQLLGGITAESATKTLQFADLHRAKELRARAIEYLARNLKTVPNWEELCRVRPDLVAEILEKAVRDNLH